MPSISTIHRKPSESNGDQIADDILRAIRRILRKTAERSRQLANDGNLTVPQLLCLRAISDATIDDPATVASIAAKVQLSAATVSRILDRLDQDGLLARNRSSTDRRKVFISLSAAGRRQVKKLPAPLHDEFLARLTKLNKSDQRRLLSSLQQVVEMMGASEMDASPLLTPESDVKPKRRAQ